MPQMRSVSWPLLDTMITGIARVAGALASVRVARKPSTPGMTMSIRIRSGRISRALRMPSAPSAAASVSKPWFSSMRRIWNTSVGESSTIRMSAMALSPSARLLPGDVPFDRRQQLVARERFRQVMLGTDNPAARPVEQAVLAGQHDHRYRAEHLVVLDQRAGLVAVQARHHDVHEDDVGLVVGNLGQRVEAIHGREHFAALLGQQRLRRTADRLAVVDDEHFQTAQAVPVTNGRCILHRVPPAPALLRPGACKLVRKRPRFRRRSGLLLTYRSTPCHAGAPAGRAVGTSDRCTMTRPPDVQYPRHIPANRPESY